MNDFFCDLERLRLPTEQLSMPMSSNGTGKGVHSKPKRINGEFLKGPIPLVWLSVASMLSGKALAVALAIWFEVGRRRSMEISLTSAILSRFGVGRKAQYRALRRLELAGLVAVVRRPERTQWFEFLKLRIIGMRSTTYREDYQCQ